MPEWTSAWQADLGACRSRPSRSPGLTQRLSYLGCSVGIGVFSAFNNFTLSLWLADSIGSYLLIGLLGNTRSFVGAIVSPLVGAWSDRVWLGWLGRRRPFILIGGLLSAALLSMTPPIGRLVFPVQPVWLPDDVARLGTTIVMILLFTVTFNAMDDLHRALLADITTSEERNGLSALGVTVEMISQVAILLVGFLYWSDAVPDAAFTVSGALVAVAILVTVLGVREREPAAWEADRLLGVEDVGCLALADVVARYRPAVMLGVVMLVYWSGVNAVMPLVSVYVRDILHGTVGEAQLLPALMLLTTMLVAIPVGALGDRFGKRPVMSVGFAIIGCAALSGLVITTSEQGGVVLAVAGLGNAAVIVLTLPLLADLVPRRHMGMATGALAASGSLAAPVASVVAGLLAETYGPRVIFALMAAMVAVAFSLMLLVDRPVLDVDGESPR